MGRKRDSRETCRVPNSSFGAALPEVGASSLNAPCSSPKTVLEMAPTSPFTLTHCPGGPSPLPQGSPPTLLVLCCPPSRSPRVLWLEQFSIAHSGFHLLAPGCSQTLLAYLPKTVGFCALGHSDSSLCPSAQGEEPAPHSRQENSGTLMSVKELRPEILGFDNL